MDTLTATQWVIDTLHSEISFKAKHLVITTVHFIRLHRCADQLQRRRGQH